MGAELLTDRYRRRTVSTVVLPVLVALAAATLVLGCGDEEADSQRSTTGTEQPYLSIAEVESVLERDRLSLVRTRQAGSSAEREGLVDLVRYADRSGRKFEIFVWRSARVAREQRSSLLADARAQHGDDASAIRAANVIAVFPERAGRIDAYRAAADAISRLAAACIRGGGGEQRLRRLCFGDGEPSAR